MVEYCPPGHAAHVRVKRLMNFPGPHTTQTSASGEGKEKQLMQFSVPKFGA